MQIIHRKKKTHLACKGLWSPAVSQLVAKTVDEPLSNSLLQGQPIMNREPKWFRVPMARWLLKFSGLHPQCAAAGLRRAY